MDLNLQLDQESKHFYEVSTSSDQGAQARWEPPIKLLLKFSTEEARILVLKTLLEHLKYAYLGPSETLPIIIASNLNQTQEKELLAILRENQEAIGWTMADIKGIRLSIVQHQIHLGKEAKPTRDPKGG